MKTLDMLKALEAAGKLTFADADGGKRVCRLELPAPIEGRGVIHRTGALDTELLEQVYISAVNLGIVDVPAEQDARICPEAREARARVITRVMDDGVKTDDGAA